VVVSVAFLGSGQTMALGHGKSINVDGKEKLSNERLCYDRGVFC